MKITLEVSEKNESTTYPWWLIIDPGMMWDGKIDTVASMVTGPFFSRESAEKYLAETLYNYGKNAAVYCCSGYQSDEYVAACKAALVSPLSGGDERPLTVQIPKPCYYRDGTVACSEGCPVANGGPGHVSPVCRANVNDKRNPTNLVPGSGCPWPSAVNPPCACPEGPDLPERRLAVCQRCGRTARGGG